MPDRFVVSRRSSCLVSGYAGRASRRSSPSQSHKNESYWVSLRPSSNLLSPMRILRANPAPTCLLGCPVVRPWTCIAIRLSDAHVHVHCRTCKSRIRLTSINHYTTVQWDSGGESLAGKGSLIHTNFDTS